MPETPNDTPFGYIPPGDAHRNRVRAAAGSALSRVVSPAQRSPNATEVAQGVLNIAPKGVDSEIARALMSSLSSGMQRMEPEQAKWFAMGAVSQALAAEQLRGSEE